MGSQALLADDGQGNTVWYDGQKWVPVERDPTAGPHGLPASPQFADVQAGGSSTAPSLTPPDQPQASQAPASALPHGPLASDLAERALKGYVSTAFPSTAGIGELGSMAGEIVDPGQLTSALQGKGGYARTGAFLKAALEASKKQFAESGQATSEGRPFAAVGHAVAGAVPVIGPTVAESVEKVSPGGTGDIPTGVGELAGMIASPLPLLARYGRGALASRFARRMHSKGLMNIAEGLAPDANPRELEHLASQAAPVLHAEGTTRGMPNRNTLAGRTQGIADVRKGEIDTFLNSPKGDVADITVAPVRAGEAGVGEWSQIPKTATTVSIKPSEFNQLSGAKRTVILENLSQEDAAYLTTGHAPVGPKGKMVPVDDPIDIDLGTYKPPMTEPKQRIYRDIGANVDLAQAASDLERGNVINDTSLMSRRQAVQLRRQLDEESKLYKPGRLVPSEPAAATRSAAAEDAANALREEINKTPKLGALNASQHTNLLAHRAVEDAASGFTAGLRGERYAIVRGGATAVRAGVGALAGVATANPLVGAGAALALPLAYKLVTSTPLKMLTANTRLAIAQAIVNGDIQLANRLASDALMVARLPTLQEQQADSSNARKMSAIE